MYGWYGDYYLGRENNGELLASRHPPPIEYISARSLINIKIADVNLTFNATFIVPEAPTIIITVEDKNSTIVLEIVLGLLVIIIVALTFVSAYFYRGAKSERKKSKKYASLHAASKVYSMSAS